MTTTPAERIVTATKVVGAPATVIFELIADPARQPEWDGNDNLATAATGQRVHEVGDVFLTQLTRDGQLRENHVVEFIERRLIAWKPSPVGEPQPGHLWRWELTPIDARSTQVTQTYDWSGLTDSSRFARARRTTPDTLMASIDRLAYLAEQSERPI